MSSFTYASLFSGIGGFEQALNSLDGECVFSSEIDKMANYSYELLYGHQTSGDITKVAESDVPDHDVLVGGFPCQTFSIAGNRAGFEDARGTLFFEAARIAKEKKPKVLILENVKNLLSHDKGNTIRVMLELLNEIGYIIDFSIVNSKRFGIAQSRERTYIIAVREDLIEVEKWHNLTDNVVGRRKRELSHIKSFNFNFNGDVELTTHLKDYLDEEYPDKYVLHTPVAEHLKPISKIPLDTPYHVLNLDMKGYESTKRVYGINGVSPTITTMGGGTTKLKLIMEDGTIRKIMPRECFRLQGFKEEDIQKLFDGGLSDAQLYKQAGNAVSIPVVKILGERILKRVGLI